jgi:hypothetical protein
LSRTCSYLENEKAARLLGLGLGQIVKETTFFPKTASFQELDALTALQDAALGTNGGSRAETTML